MAPRFFIESVILITRSVNDDDDRDIQALDIALMYCGQEYVEVLWVLHDTPSNVFSNSIQVY